MFMPYNETVAQVFHSSNGAEQIYFLQEVDIAVSYKTTS